ncbi:hypothetical protein FRC11_007259, partial [Ceratobasidium sp. 423]
HEMSTVATNSGSNVGTQQHPRTQSNTPPSDGNEPPAHNSSQPSHEQDNTSLPEDDSATQRPQPSPISEGAPDGVPDQSQAGQHTAPPPINRVTLQPSEVPLASHCSNCQCTNHPSRTPKATNVTASTPHRCSVPSIQGRMPTQPPPSTPVSAPVTPTTGHTSFNTARPTHPERIHSGSMGRHDQFSTYPDPTLRDNAVPPATQHLDCSCSSHANSRTNDHRAAMPSPASRTTTFDTGSDCFVSPPQCCSQPSFSGTGRPKAESPAGYSLYNNQVPDSGAYYSGCDPQEPMGTQGCHHTHNRLPHERYPDPPYRVSHDYPLTHVYDNVPQPRQMHEGPPRPPTHQDIRVNSQGYHFSQQSRSHTNDPYATPRNHTHRTSLPPQRNSTNGNAFHWFQERRAHPHVPSSSMAYGDNPAGEYHGSPRSNLSTILENSHRPASHHSWETLGGPMVTNPCCEHGAQPMPPSHAYTGSQPPPSSNPSVITYDHPHAHSFENSFQGPYMVNGVPAHPYPTREPPAKRWTEAVWDNQGPVRTESPSPYMRS